MLHRNIRLLPLWRREVLRRRPFGTSPVSLSNKKRTPNSCRIALARLLIHDVLLGLDDRARLALVVDADDFAAQLEGAAGGGGGEGLQEGHETLPVDDAAGVEFGDAGDGGAALRGVEVDYFLRGVLECWSDLLGAVIVWDGGAYGG